MFTDEEVDAAARAFRGDDYFVPWERLADHLKYKIRAQVRRALEAAAAARKPDVADKLEDEEEVTFDRDEVDYIVGEWRERLAETRNALQAERDAALARAEKAEAELARLTDQAVTVLRHIKDARTVVQGTVMDAVTGPAYLTYGIHWNRVEAFLASLASNKGCPDG